MTDLDPRTAAAERKLMIILEQLGIATITRRHAPLFSVEESRRKRGDIDGGHCKTLFLKDKKGVMLLVVVQEERRLDMKKLSRCAALPTGRLSFASAELMREVLGVTPGAVTPFALINLPPEILRQGRLTVVLDKAMMAQEKLNYHPLHNAATTSIRAEDLDKFIRHMGFGPVIMDFDDL